MPDLRYVSNCSADFQEFSHVLYNVPIIPHAPALLFPAPSLPIQMYNRYLHNHTVNPCFRILSVFPASSLRSGKTDMHHRTGCIPHCTASVSIPLRKILLFLPRSGSQRPVFSQVSGSFPVSPFLSPRKLLPAVLLPDSSIGSSSYPHPTYFSPVYLHNFPVIQGKP